MKPRASRNSPSNASIIVNCEKIKTRRPSERSFGSSLSRSTSLPLAASIASRTWGEEGGGRRGEHLHAARGSIASRTSAAVLWFVIDCSTPRMRYLWGTRRGGRRGEQQLHAKRGGGVGCVRAPW